MLGSRAKRCIEPRRRGDGGIGPQQRRLGRVLHAGADPAAACAAPDGVAGGGEARLDGSLVPQRVCKQPPGDGGRRRHESRPQLCQLRLLLSLDRQLMRQWRGGSIGACAAKRRRKQGRAAEPARRRRYI